MKIEKGNKFLCLRDVIMFDGDIAYKKGEVYRSDIDGCITNINREECHRWTSEDAPHIYFKPLKVVDRIYTKSTDKLRDLHRNYKYHKSGYSSEANFFDNKSCEDDTFCFYASEFLHDGYYLRNDYDYVTEDTFIELAGLTNKSTIYQDEYSCVNNGLQDVSVKKTFNPQPYYDNSKGSLYKVATERGWSSYIFDVVKRLERGGKKDPLRQEIEKSIDVLKIWLNEID